MKVYRVAHESTKFDGMPAGPYSLSSGVPAADAEPVFDMHYDHTDLAHLSPHADPELRTIRPDERCGFDSMDALREWFDGWCATLHTCHFRVFTYEVPAEHVRVGRNGQALFSAAKATEVGYGVLPHDNEQLEFV